MGVGVLWAGGKIADFVDGRRVEVGVGWAVGGGLRELVVDDVLLWHM